MVIDAVCTSGCKCCTVLIKPLGFAATDGRVSCWSACTFPLCICVSAFFARVDKEWRSAVVICDWVVHEAAWASGLGRTPQAKIENQIAKRLALNFTSMLQPFRIGTARRVSSFLRHHYKSKMRRKVIKRLDQRQMGEWGERCLKSSTDQPQAVKPLWLA